MIKHEDKAVLTMCHEHDDEIDVHDGLEFMMMMTTMTDCFLGEGKYPHCVPQAQL